MAGGWRRPVNPRVAISSPFPSSEAPDPSEQVLRTTISQDRAIFDLLFQCPSGMIAMTAMDLR